MAQLTSPMGIIRALWRRSWIIILVLAIGVPGALYYALSQVRLYSATAIIQIEAPQIVVAADGQARATVTADNQLELIEQKLMSRENLLAIMEQFDLLTDEAPRTEQVNAFRSAIAINKLSDPSQAYRPDVQPTGLSITVQLPAAQFAADIANMLLDEIITEAAERAQGRAERTLEFFSGEEQRVGDQIVNLAAEFARFKQQNADALPDAVPRQREQLARLEEAQLTLDQRLIEVQTGSDRVREEDLARQTELLQQQRELIDAQIGEIDAALSRAPEVERQYSAFAREIARLQTQFDAITARRTEAAMTQQIEAQEQSARYTVLERAEAPYYPVTASRKKLAIAGAMASLMVAVGLALLVEVMSPAIRSAAQLERQLGVTPVIVIPRLMSRGQRLRRIRNYILAGLAALAALAFSLKGWLGALIGGLLGLGRVSAQ